MHILHKILVYNEDGFDSMAENERISSARSMAENSTDSYFGDAYDWRETETAGAWSEEYPKQLYFADENLEWFINEIKESIQSQKAEIASYMEEIKSANAADFETLINGLIDDNLQPEAVSSRFNSNIAFALLKVSRLVYGDYDCDSCIYNTVSSTARIYNEDIEAIKQEPNKWALVMFDYHY